MINIKTFFDDLTATFTYVVHDEKTKKAAIIDSVLNFDIYSGAMTTESADAVICYITEQSLSLEWILETHIHADHITAASYLQEKCGGKIGIGEHIKKVLSYWVPLFNIQDDTPITAEQFDVLFEDEQIIQLGETSIQVLHTPGHTPACACYKMDDVVFVGDTLFAPDIGTARTDFPGGSAEDMYASALRLLALPDDTKLYVGHDYPTQGRKLKSYSTVKEQKETNGLIGNGITQNDYVKARHARDVGKKVPHLLLPSIQMNLRCGKKPIPENNGTCYIKIPLSY